MQEHHGLWAYGAPTCYSVSSSSPFVFSQSSKDFLETRFQRVSILSTLPSGKLPLPSRAPHVVGCVFFFAALVAGSCFVISARSAPRASRELHLCGVRSFFARVSHWRLFCLLNPGWASGFPCFWAGMDGTILFSQRGIGAKTWASYRSANPWWKSRSLIKAALSLHLSCKN